MCARPIFRQLKSRAEGVLNTGFDEPRGQALAIWSITVTLSFSSSTHGDGGDGSSLTFSRRRPSLILLKRIVKIRHERLPQPRRPHIPHGFQPNAPSVQPHKCPPQPLQLRQANLLPCW